MQTSWSVTSSAVLTVTLLLLFSLRKEKTKTDRNLMCVTVPSVFKWRTFFPCFVNRTETLRFSQDERKRVNTKKTNGSDRIADIGKFKPSNGHPEVYSCKNICIPRVSYIDRRQSCENCEPRMRKLYHSEHGKYQTFSYRFTVE